jgi:hypothetical protein
VIQDVVLGALAVIGVVLAMLRWRVENRIYVEREQRIAFNVALGRWVIK